MSETYTVKQAALVLALSEKRVRQLLDEGKLRVESLSPVSMLAVDVLDLRNLRASSSRIREANVLKRERAKSRDELLIEQFSHLVDQINSNNLKQIEAVTKAQEVERENFFKLLSARDAEIARLSSRRSFFSR